MLQLRAPGKTLSIYIGRGNQYVGFFVAMKSPPAYLRIQDKFLDFIRSHLVGAKISKIVFDPNTQRFKMEFKTNTYENFFEFGYSERQLFFLLKEGDLYFSSWNNQITKAEVSDYPLSEVDKVKYKGSISKYLAEEDAKSSGTVVVKKREKFLLKKIENISKDINLNNAWKELEQQTLNDELELNGSEIIFKGIRFNFLGLKSDWEKKDLIFKKIKKLRRGEGLLKERLDEAKAELLKIKSGELTVETTKEKAIQVLWKVSNNKQVNKSSNDGEYLEFNLLGISGYLGLNAGGNDKIRSLAHKDHYWFHIENYPGSHIIIKTDDITKINSEVFEIIASMLRDYSKLSIETIPIIYTQVKNLKGIKGVKGEVTMKKVKYLVCPYRSFKEIISIV